MKVLVTGATGFVGSYVVNTLLKLKHEVIATSLNESKALLADWYNQVLYIPFDITNPTLYLGKDQSISEYFKRPDHVIHLAWKGVSDCTGMFHIEKNLMQHYDFLKMLVVDGVQGLTITGTCLEYGFKNGMKSEEHPPKPSVAYAIAKDALRRFLVELQKHASFSLQWVRLFYMYGKGQHNRSLLQQLYTAISNNEKFFNMSGGEQERDYLPVDLVAEYLVEIVTKGNKNDIYNCCSGKPIKIKQFVEDEVKKMNAEIHLNLGFYPYKEYEPMSFWGNSEKIKKLLI